MGPGHTCLIHNIPLDREREENWFFKLSAFQEQLERLYAERADFVRPKARYNEALSFIHGGLEDVSLSRPKLTWGVSLPWDPEQVMYVWFDALLNYVTALTYAREGEDLTERYWPAFHIIGKDILKFHAVYWPAFLMAAGYEVPKGMFIHGYLLMEGQKMSKSLGNVLDPFEVIERFGADTLRYYCFREVSFGQDGSVSAAGFEARYDSELANEYGNLASRTLAMIDRYRDGGRPGGRARSRARGRRRRAGRARGQGMRAARPRRADPGARGDLEAGAAAQPLRRGDPPVGPREGGGGFPGTRSPADQSEQARITGRIQPLRAGDRLDSVLYNLAEGLRVTTLLLTAYMPETGERMLDALGVEGREIQAFGTHGGGQTVEKLPPLFPKIETAAA